MTDGNSDEDGALTLSSELAERTGVDGVDKATPSDEVDDGNGPLLPALPSSPSTQQTCTPKWKRALA